MNDSKNMILAVVLSALVLLGWSWAANRFFPTAQPQSTKIENGKQQPVSQPTAQPQPTAAAPKAMRARNVVLASTPRIRIVTPSLQGSINLKGAQIDDLTLVTQRQTIAKNSPPVRLLSPLGAPGAYIASFGWTVEGAPAPNLDTVWTASNQVLTPGRPVTLTTEISGVRYEQRISIDDGYLFTVEQRATNASGHPVIVRPIGLVSRASKSNDRDSWTMHVGPISVFDEKADYDVDYKTLDEGAQSFANVKGWLGFTDHFWLTALAPVDAQMAADFRRSPSGGYQADYALQPSTLGQGQTVTSKVNLFAGAKEKTWLDRYEDAGTVKISKSIDWGWFEFFMRPIFDLLMFLFRTVGNFGVAIICLTLIVRLIMFPIAQKQFQSMAAMRKLQPKMKAVQERWKDDKARQQQEILKLYQEEKINPAAGCLPLLLQIPVFYALYKVLLVSVEMRHQPFVAWIRDLSAPDPLTPVNLFGLLQFTPPAFLAIGVLPIMVGATQWLSMKLNPQPMDSAQAQIFAIMPWVLIFVMAPFAAGLQLYWMTNNILTIAQQWWLYRRYGLHLSDTHPVHT
ncbi:membrane protein insertase YidC [Sphingomonas hankyongi]|uniref:Membrane protein insertase YidC n=1 Tax=Sphingomonas hankyongi TaxID=2908209 RepID=A0ABT0S4W6_9SPHN|nr:membrane protein insertase YidC [Sphingomonas hankyongi]